MAGITLGVTYFELLKRNLCSLCHFLYRFLIHKVTEGLDSTLLKLHLNL